MCPFCIYKINSCEAAADAERLDFGGEERKEKRPCLI